jgi:hypothetical protein
LVIHMYKYRHNTNYFSLSKYIPMFYIYFLHQLPSNYNTFICSSNIIHFLFSYQLCITYVVSFSSLFIRSAESPSKIKKFPPTPYAHAGRFCTSALYFLYVSSICITSFTNNFFFHLRIILCLHFLF